MPGGLSCSLCRWEARGDGDGTGGGCEGDGDGGGCCHGGGRDVRQCRRRRLVVVVRVEGGAVRQQVTENISSQPVLLFIMTWPREGR
jgi:hypothetical protein